MKIQALFRGRPASPVAIALMAGIAVYAKLPVLPWLWLGVAAG